MNASDYIAGIASVIACISLWLSIKAQNRAQMATKRAVISELRLSACELTNRLELLDFKWRARRETHPEWFDPEVDPDPKPLLETMEEVETFLRDEAANESDEVLERLKITIQQTRSRFETMEKKLDLQTGT